MSGATTYNVILALSTTGNLGASLGSAAGHARNADHAVKSLGEGARRVGEGIASMGEKLGGALSGIADKAIDISAKLATVGAAAGLALATYGVVKLNNNLEQTQISLGAIFQAQGFASTFERGFSMASDQLAKMKQDVKTLPGDLGQLSDIMKMIATPAAQGGATPDSIRKLAGRTMLTSTILGVQQEVASREMANLLAGRAGAHNILGSRMGLIGGEAKKFNAMAPEARLARINKELDKYQGAADRFGQSFIAQWTTLKDNIKYGMLAPATSGLFERVKHAIGEINDYLDTHKEKVQQIADLVSLRLTNAWDYLEEKFKRIEPVVARIADKIAHMTGSQVGHVLGMGAAGVLGTKLAGVGIQAGGSILGGAMRMAPMLAGGGGASSLAAALGALANPVGLIAAGAAAAALAVAALSVAGAIDALTDKTNVLHDRAVKAWDEVGTKMTEALGRLGEAAGHAWDALRPFTDTLGVALLDSLAKGAQAFANMAAGIDNATMAIRRSPWYSVMFPGDTAAGYDASVANAYGAAIGAQIMTQQRLMELPGNGTGEREIAQRGAGGGGGGTHIQKVEIVVTGNNDPSRVARLTLEELQKLGRNPTRSSAVPNYEAGRP